MEKTQGVLTALLTNGLTYDDNNEKKLPQRLATDTLFICGRFYEYNLYNVDVEGLEEAVNNLIADFWKNKAPAEKGVFSKNRCWLIEKNLSLHRSVKEMMKNEKANISTTKFYKQKDGKHTLNYIVNFTNDYEKYSILNIAI